VFLVKSCIVVDSSVSLYSGAISQAIDAGYIIIFCILITRNNLGFALSRPLGTSNKAPACKPSKSYGT
jgi:hypothetical protein